MLILDNIFTLFDLVTFGLMCVVLFLQITIEILSRLSGRQLTAWPLQGFYYLPTLGILVLQSTKFIVNIPHVNTYLLVGYFLNIVVMVLSLSKSDWQKILENL